MKKSKVIFLVSALAVSGFVMAGTGFLKIVNPNKNSEIYVLNSYSCGDTVPQAHSEKAMELGKETERKSYAQTVLGCYEFNDSEKIITFFYKDKRVIKVPYAKIQPLDIETGKPMISTSYYTPVFSSIWGRSVIESTQLAQMKKLREQSYAESSSQSTPTISTATTSTGKVIGQTFDSESNANFFLYDGSCRLTSYSSSYPYRFDAKKADTGDNLGEGCYSFNQQSQQVFLMASTGKTVSLPMSAFQGGGSQQGSGGNGFMNFITAITNGLNAANNVANPPNRPIPNLTPSFTQGTQIQVQQPNFRTPPPNKQLNCTTTYFGGVANTTCN
jgi:hypothetical protein